jgi:cell division protein FtsB
MKPSQPAPPPDDDFTEDADLPPDDEPAEASASPDLSSLPVAGITRRRVGFLLGALVSAWIVIAFARQVAEATAATASVENLRDQNAALAGRLAALEREADLIQRQEWVVQQARGYRLGGPGETPFSLRGDAPALAPDAPGSASVSLGATGDEPTPLESWLSLLFGPSR